MSAVKVQETSLNYIGGEWVDAADHEVIGI
jgi:hypothetical protein